MAVLRRVSDDEPRPIRQLNPEVPDWLEAIVERLHAKDPADRFASASELADLLGHCLAYVQEPLTVLLAAELIPRRPRLVRAAGGAVRWRSGFLAWPLVLGLAFAYPIVAVPRRVTPSSRPPGPRWPPPNPTRVPTSGPRGVADETDDPFREAWERARRIEADLYRPADPPVKIRSPRCPGPGRWGRFLERELAPGRDAAPALRAVPPVPDPMTIDRR